MRTRIGEDDNLEPQLAPLIDCMFILLIFFLVTTTLKKKEKELPLKLPVSTIGVDQPERTDLVILSVDAEGRKYFGAEPVTTSVLLERLATIAAQGGKRRIRIDADEKTAYRDIVEVVEALQFQGLHNVGLRIKSPYDRRFE